MFTPGGTLIYAIDPTKQGHWHLHLCAALQEIFRLPEPPHFLVPAYTATIDRWLDPRTKQLRTSTELYLPVRHHQALLNTVFGTAKLAWQVAPWEESSCDPMILETYRHQFPQLWEDWDLIERLDRPEGFNTYSWSYSLKVGLGKVERESTLPLSLENPLPERDTLQAKVTTAGNNNTYPQQNLSWYGEHLMVNMNPEDFANPEQSAKLSSASQSPELLGVPYTGNISEFAGTDANLPPELPSTKLPTSPTESQANEPHSQPQPTQSYVLRLFVSQNSEATEQTLKSLHELLENSIRHPYTLKVIDVFKHPEQAEANQVSATPTLVRTWPLPVRRLVGDLTDVERVLRILVTPSEE